MLHPRKRTLTLVLAAALLVGATQRAARAEETEFEIGLRSGFRQDDIRILGADPFGGESRVELKETKIHHLEVYGRAIVAQGLYYRGSIDLGWYYDGALFASENGDDGSPGTFPLGIRPYQLEGVVDGEMIFDVTSGIGYQMSFFGDRFRIAPLGGYSFNKNNVRTGATKFSAIDGTNTVGPSTGFDTEWRGPWIGFDASVLLSPELSVLAEFEHHWVNLEGKLRLATPERPEPRNGDGTGFSWGVAARYRFAKRFSGELLYRGRNWSADTGRSFRVDWKSYVLTAGAILEF